jgi:parallel beta-helix repeat protein
VLLATGAGFADEAQAATTPPPVKMDASPWFNVKDFGAGNDRSNDDTPFFQSAINAAAVDGGTVYVPQGTYKIRSSLVMRSKVHLLGAGAEASIIQAGTSSLRMVMCTNDLSDYSFEGLTFEGFGSGSGTLTSLTECGVFAMDGKNIRISRCMFKKITNGVNLERCQHASITDCTFYFILATEGPNEGFGIVLQGGGNHIVQGNQFENVGKHGIVLNGGCTYSVVANNVVQACKDTAIYLYSNLKACSHHLITGNLISAYGLGDQESSCMYGIRLKDGCSFNTVVNNAVSRSSAAGIQLDAEEKSGDDRPYGNTITGNTVKYTVRGIAVLNGDGNTVKCNEVRRADSGVLVDTIGEGSGSFAKQNIVTGNSLIQCSGAAVKIGSAGCQGSIVFGNAGFENAAGLKDNGTETATSGI